MCTASSKKRATLICTQFAPRLHRVCAPYFWTFLAQSHHHHHYRTFSIVLKQAWRILRIRAFRHYRTFPLSSSKLSAYCAFALFGTCRDKPAPKSAVVVQMQAYGDMDSETSWPSFSYLFCIYFSKFLAPLLHELFEVFDANMSLFASV